ncbi:cytochrome-c peroxidase [Leisingera sp. ANG-DT]|uniref:cytochrome-c peroxidase n=1 Tax=Leisingera sp. ANG-DT TaxID=1577897 RepID=UPI00057C926D|nr:cytochrome c peroxidase [Leisingera sp. ANG-DT]KIC15333.1 cytochrome C peroxidase [Leisingera sp. ANG-DT]
MARQRWIATAAAVVAIGTGASYVIRALPPDPTPVADFSAPFVFGRFSVPQDNPLTEEAFALGRRLFYDPALSGGNDRSCATCHIQRLAFTDGLPTAAGLNGESLEFSSMSLVNLLWGQERFFWDGRALSLEQQALLPIENPQEMAQDLEELVRELKGSRQYRRMFRQAYGEVSSENIARALATFMRMLISAGSKYDRFLRGEAVLTEQEELGRKLFMAHPDTKVSLRGGNCIDCHSQFLTSGFRDGLDGFSNNGLDKDEDLPAGLMAVTDNPAHKGFFKVPTLRNIAVTAPYMHDGRLQTLEDVMDHYNGGVVVSPTLSPLILEADNAASPPGSFVGLRLTDSEKAAIIAFLHTLTDEAFLSDARFSNPLEGEL